MCTINTRSSSISVADELTKIAKLKEQGILTEDEFTKLKKDLLDENK
jgi:Short C-terminal domain